MRLESIIFVDNHPVFVSGELFLPAAPSLATIVKRMRDEAQNYFSYAENRFCVLTKPFKK